MPRTCTICRHPAHAAIDAALTRGTPLRTIADQHGVSKTALLRHKAHVRPPVSSASHPRTAPVHDRALLTGLLRQAITGQRQENALCRARLSQVRPGEHPDLEAVLRQGQTRLGTLLAELLRWELLRAREAPASPARRRT